LSENKLYIIGNGFDIFHRVRSRYSDFKHYLSKTDTPLHDLVEEFIPVEENWSDLEEALAGIDVDSIVDAASQFLVSYGVEDWSDAYHDDYQYEVNRIVEGLSRELKSRFSEWVKQLYIPRLNEFATQLLNLSKTAKFLTFNYTSSLSSIYQIPRSNIIYIHGEAQKDQDLVLGHAWNPVDIPWLNDVVDTESLDTRVMEGNEIIHDYFGRTFKDTQKIIESNKPFFANLKAISTIYVLGHSLSSVDFDYFREIVNNIHIDKVKWKISYYGNDELAKHRKTMENLRVPEGAVTFCDLGEL
jgi:hypothetical protein